MLRNLESVKILPSRPGRSCRKSTGEPSLSQTVNATTTKTGESTTRPSAEPTMSILRLTRSYGLRGRLMRHSECASCCEQQCLELQERNRSRAEEYKCQ